jgi:hypothetical protein
MKTRKPPIVLGAIVVVLIGGVAINNMMALKASNPNPEEAAPQLDSKNMTTASREGDAKEEMKRRMENAKKAGKPDKAKMLSENGGGDTGPTIMVPKDADYKPVPNDSSPSTQWYTKGNRLNPGSK